MTGPHFIEGDIVRILPSPAIKKELHGMELPVKRWVPTELYIVEYNSKELVFHNYELEKA